MLQITSRRVQLLAVTVKRLANLRGHGSRPQRPERPGNPLPPRRREVLHSEKRDILHGHDFHCLACQDRSKSTGKRQPSTEWRRRRLQEASRKRKISRPALCRARMAQPTTLRLNTPSTVARHSTRRSPVTGEHNFLHGRTPAREFGGKTHPPGVGRNTSLNSRGLGCGADAAQHWVGVAGACWAEGANGDGAVTICQPHVSVEEGDDGGSNSSNGADDIDEPTCTPTETRTCLDKIVGHLDVCLGFGAYCSVFSWILGVGESCSAAVMTCLARNRAATDVAEYRLETTCE